MWALKRLVLRRLVTLGPWVDVVIQEARVSSAIKDTVAWAAVVVARAFERRRSAHEFI